MHFLKFLGIGAQKSGTTWLYEKLRLHPDIAFPASKEVHFWDKRYALGIDWYKSLFSAPELELKYCGEITPAYAILPPELIRECRAHFADVRLIYLLRNPIDRAWSNAKMALARVEMDISEASDQWFMDHFRSRGSLLRGDHEQCLRNWLSVYPANQLLVCFWEELRDTPDILLHRCLRHLGVDEAAYDWSADLTEKVFPTFEHTISDRLRLHLQRMYQPKIKSLEELLEVNLSHWG